MTDLDRTERALLPVAAVGGAAMAVGVILFAIAPDTTGKLWAALVVALGVAAWGTAVFPGIVRHRPPAVVASFTTATLAQLVAFTIASLAGLGAAAERTGFVWIVLVIGAVVAALGYVAYRWTLERASKR